MEYLEDAPGNSTVRTQLRVLERKGLRLSPDVVVLGLTLAIALSLCLALQSPEPAADDRAVEVERLLEAGQAATRIGDALKEAVGEAATLPIGAIVLPGGNVKSSPSTRQPERSKADCIDVL